MNPSIDIGSRTTVLLSLTLALLVCGAQAFAQQSQKADPAVATGDASISLTTEFADHVVFYEPGKTVVLLGVEETVFDWTYDRCFIEDCPDMPAHAFRDASGTINLLAANYFNIRMTGPDFNSLQRDPSVIKWPAEDPYPWHYDDTMWLSSHWVEAGTDLVHAITCMEYRGHRHPAVSGCTCGYYDCLWGALTYATSWDGGKKFSDYDAPDQLIITVPYEYEPNLGSWVGTIHPSNIVFKNGYYYCAFWVIGTINSKPYKDLLPGWSMMRTDDLQDPTSWRVWDGEGFNMVPVNPYTAGSFDPRDHIPATLSYNTISPGGWSLLYSNHLEKYVTTEQIDVYSREAESVVKNRAFLISYSDDIIDWDLPSIFRIIDDSMLAELFPTFIYHDCQSYNFEELGEYSHLYFSRVYRVPKHLWYDRDLIRMPVRMVTWDEAESVLRNAGFDYYGISLLNEPAAGNNLLQIIGTEFTGITFFEKLAKGHLVFERNENRMGIFAIGVRGYIDPQVDVRKSLLFFPGFDDYQDFIQDGIVAPGTQNIDARNPIALNGGYGLVLKNSPPRQTAPMLIRNSDGLKCEPTGLEDFEGDDIHTIIAFKKNGEHFAEAIFPFEDAQIELPFNDILNYGGGAEINEYLPSPFWGGSMLPQVSGKVGGAYYFDGFSFLHLQDARGLELNTAESMTLELFAKLDDYAGRSILSNNDRFDDQGAEDDSFYYGIVARLGVAYFYMNPTGRIQDLQVVDTLRYDGTGLLETGNFHHLAFVLDAEAGLIKSYVDGELRQLKAYDPSVPAVHHRMENRIWIGAPNNKFMLHGGSRFKGVLDELRIYKHALTDEMIQAHHHGDYSIISNKFLGGEWACEVTPSDGQVTGNTMKSGILATDTFTTYQR